ERRQTSFMGRKQHAGARCSRRLKTEFSGDFEFAGATSRAVAEWIRQMSRFGAESSFNDGTAQFHFGARRVLWEPGQDRVIDRMRANRDKRIGRKLRKLGPVHA